MAGVHRMPCPVQEGTRGVEVERDVFPWDVNDDPPCRFCKGKGYQSVEPNSSLTYPCPDCQGEDE